MASVEDRWHRVVKDAEGNPVLGPNGKPLRERTERYDVGLRWLVRWRDPDGRERKLSFAKEVQAKSHAATVEADKLRGTYIDPSAGIDTFGAYRAAWLAMQTTDPLTRENIAGRLRRYVEGTALDSAQLRKIRPSTIQAWIKGLPASLAESTKGLVFADVSAILNAAVADEKIGKNPCQSTSVRRPRAVVREIEPWSREWVSGMHAALPKRYRPLVSLGAGLGLRQGELFGLSPDDIDWLRGWVTVQRQVKIVERRLVFALPKGKKVRKVPLPASVRDELAAYLAAYPAKTVTLPWETAEGKLTAVPLVLTTQQARALHRERFNSFVWRPTIVKAGIEPGRQNGCHALRHYYASVLLDAGESIKALSSYLGHSSAVITLKTYTHLMPASEDRTKAAVDADFAAWRAPTVPQGVEERGVTSVKT
jgi:integrase